MDYTKYTGGSASADHLCVLVHGLWGNPNHLANVAKSLRNQYPPESLYILAAKRNSGSFTYDGIELGGERVCAEIEEELRLIESKGGKIKKLSIVGYSLGGLVARYAVGLLHAKGVLDTLECMNFTTFATPHLGVRSPLRGWYSHLWNGLGARTLSKSGHQLFAIDKFRDTGKPLLEVLADESSIFMGGLKKFKRHVLYTNIVNDRTAVHYTTGISKTDVYKDIDNIKPNYVSGYEDIVLDPAHPVGPRPKVKEPRIAESTTATAVRYVKNIPFTLALGVFIPVGIMAFLLTSVVQTIRSSKRIKLHEQGMAGIQIEGYRVPLWIKEMREEVESAYETINNSQNEQYLGSDDEGDSDLSPATSKLMARERRMSVPSQPTLALAPSQFSMIESLDKLKWRKFPIWIRKSKHTHAAIIVRMEKEDFSEGWTVLNHFAKEEFAL